MPFIEIAEILKKGGYQSGTGRPFTAQGVAMIYSRVWSCGLRLWPLRGAVVCPRDAKGSEKPAVEKEA